MKPLVLMLMFAMSSLCVLAANQKTLLPCEATSLAVAADGSGLWFECSQGRAAWKRAEAAGQNSLPPGSTADPTEVYWLPSGSQAATKIAGTKGMIYLFEAPVGSDALVVIQQESGPDKVVLYNGKQREKEVPVDSVALLWSADAKKIYSYGGNTAEADAWDILAVYDLNTGTTQRKKLREPTEIIRVCPGNGMLYSVTPKYPGFAGVTVEYTPDIQFVRKVRGWIGARFSASCAYVASEADYHGPLPWDIYDVNTGEALYSFAGLDDNETETYRFVQWNPKHESLLLREHILGKNRKDLLEVFDVQTGTVLQTLPDTDVVAWSADGDTLLVGEGHALVSHAVTQSASAHQ